MVRLIRLTHSCAKKNFPQFSPTFLGAKVVAKNLVLRYLTVAARVLGCSFEF